MIVQDPLVKGGIAAVVNGYYNSELENKYKITYVQSYKDGSKIDKLWKAIKAYLRFLKIIISDTPDIVHMHTSFGASFYRQIPFIYMAGWKKVPIINHIHGPEFDKFYEQASEKKKKLIKKIYNKCTFLITLSEEWKQNFLNIVPENKIAVIENYSTLVDDIDYDERKYNQVLFLGAIIQRKGCFDMPEIISRVTQKAPNSIFVIAGDGELEDLKKALEDRRVINNCILPGWVRDKQKDRLLRESGVFFLPSYNEGMPMAILDAMGYSLPIVSTKVGGIPKIVINDQNGYLKSPGDIEGLADSLCELLNDIPKSNEMGLKSAAVVKHNYTLEMHLQKLYALYEAASNDDK